MYGYVYSITESLSFSYHGIEAICFLFRYALALWDRAFQDKGKALSAISDGSRGGSGRSFESLPFPVLNII